MAELVASATKREEEVLEVAAKMGAVPQIAAIGVTSYAGGASGHDSGADCGRRRSLGLTPNIHLTCVGQDRRGVANTLATLESLRIHNTFCISGDWPKNSPTPPVFDIDSVQLAAAVSELRRKNGTPFHVSCAVSPFKYQREDCLYQYVKLEKKIAAGANMAITQVGWDAKKFIELKRYLDERG
jgi:methylenetetrahydrofolate reductase (NADPH)